MSWLRTSAYDSTFQNRKEYPGSEKKRAKRIRAVKEQVAGTESGIRSGIESRIRSGIESRKRSRIEGGIRSGIESGIESGIRRADSIGGKGALT